MPVYPTGTSATPPAGPARKLTRFETAVTRLLKKHGLLEDFNTRAHFYVRFDMPHYDRLVIERHGELIAVAHYFEQNGDLIADPEVELHYPDWTPTALTQVFGGRREKFFERNGQTLVDIHFHRQVAPFLSTWGANIDAQGWAERATITASNLYEDQGDDEPERDQPPDNRVAAAETGLETRHDGVANPPTSSPGIPDYVQSALF